MFKNLSAKGINVPDGFAVTSEAFWLFLKENNFGRKLRDILENLDVKEFSNLHEVGRDARNLIASGIIPDNLSREIKKAYKKLMEVYGEEEGTAVAV